jgi:hypothetical protein
VQQAIPGTQLNYWWRESDTGPASTSSDQADYLGSAWQQADNVLGVDVTASAVARTSYNFQDPGHCQGYYCNRNNTILFRCDSYNLKYAASGCVNALYTPTLDYDATKKPLLAPIAQHVYDAQRHIQVTAWGVPQDALPWDRTQDPLALPTGTPLTYQPVLALQTANRTAACRNFVRYDPDDTCDEFPLASSYEGGGGRPNYPDINQWYSLAHVPSLSQKSQGGITAYFYGANRVLDHDEFYVNARLSDGTWSWTASQLTHCCDSPDIPDGDSSDGQ